ncbi:hypothetical protein SAOR_03165 [Salinisphaera orenii MK-B5]|uniref:DUF1641 domain-containing protein n=1 Tax=Salinisphaera orenii MK-B5 TaxID=856730 RepID=A0A423PVB5_9GAMM|nr:hypothetical protein [Salinisphaera orenii]ROO29548.1 hypothetical protein SAOR_03165 [Salinisphaera orenii MK-B5]
MAEQIQYRPADAKRFRPETESEMAQFESRVAEINGLLDELYESGVIRWLKDFTGAMPEISTIALDGMNTPQGRAGFRNLLVLAQQLGRIDPDRLERTLAAAQAGLDKAGEPAGESTPYNPPGVTGVFKLMHDKELWSALAPLIAGAKAFSAARREQAEESEQTETGSESNDT